MTSNSGCAYCSREIRVSDVNEITEGDHISMNGNYLNKNKSGTRKSPYKHHAIVETIRVLNTSEAILTLIHWFDSPFDDSLKLQRTSQHIDLRVKDVWRIQYSDGCSNEKALQRARTKLQNDDHDSYFVLTTNCEHFCVYCYTGVDLSFQVHNAIQTLKDAGSNVVLYISKIVNQTLIQRHANFIGKILKVTFKDSTIVKIVLGVMVGIATFQIARYAYLHYIKHCMCQSCFMENIETILVQCFPDLTAQVVTFFVGAYICIRCSLSWEGAFACTTALATSFFFGQCIVKQILDCIRSPVPKTSTPVENIQDVHKGDVLSYSFRDLKVMKIRRYCVVSEIKESTVKAIFFSKQGTLVERKIQITEKQDLKNHCYDRIDVHEPDEVVRRIKLRLGEKRHRFGWRDEAKACHWAKCRDHFPDGDYSCADTYHFQEKIDLVSNESLPQVQIDHHLYKTLATESNCERLAVITEDLTVGSKLLIKDRLLLWSEVTVIHVHEQGHRNARLTVIDKKKMKTMEIDLTNRTVFVKELHPSFKSDQREVMMKAHTHLKKHMNDPERQTHYIENVVLKDDVFHCTHSDDIEVGDVISFYDHSHIKTTAVVVSTELCKEQEIFIVKLRLYIFLTRNVIEKRLRLDQELVVKKTYKGYALYPKDIVLKRVELLKNLENVNKKIENQALWVKVLQSPSIVTFLERESGRSNPAKCLLVPQIDGGKKKVIDISTRIACSDVRGHSCLKRGQIIDFRYWGIRHQGILMDFKRVKNDTLSVTITVIHFGSDLLFSRDIRKETFIRTYRDLGIYRYPKGLCKNSTEITEVAEVKLSQNVQWSASYKSWDLSVECALRHRCYEMISLPLLSTVDIPKLAIISIGTQTGLVLEVHDDETILAASMGDEIEYGFIVDLKETSGVRMCIINRDQVLDMGDEELAAVFTYIMWRTPLTIIKWMRSLVVKRA